MKDADCCYFVHSKAAPAKKFYIQEWNPDLRKVVFFIHGFPGSSDHAKLMTSSPVFETFRLIAVDRPGYGQSDFQDDLSPRQFALQMRDLLNELQVDKFHLLSVSGGAPYSMALAHLLQDRVVKMCSISGVAPLTAKNFRYMNPRQKKTWVLSRIVPTKLQRMILNRVWEQGLDKIDEFLFTADAMEGPDQRVFTHPDISNVLAKTMRGALSQGPQGVLQDIHVYAKNWGFPTEEIPCPITLWHGAKDDIVHIAYAQEMKTRLMNADLRIADDEGHYSIAMNFRDQILSDLLEV